jgi:GAF domain
MHDPFVADAGPDPAARAVEIARAHHAFLTGGRRAASGVRDIVLESWTRSINAHVDPDGEAPVTLLDADLAGYREAHPLATVLPILRELVGRAAVDSHHIMAVTDSSGLILWAEGYPAALALGERIHLVEGAVWNERDAGTNAMGTALAVDEAVHIFSAEHFRHPVQAWTCAAAPIHDPATGRVLGTIDVTGGSTIAHPHSMALVRAAARAAEAELAWHRIDPAHLWLPGPHRSVRLEALNRAAGVLHLDGERVRLGRRLTEILILLHSRPEGLNGEQLADALYDGRANPTTVRVELNRLRRVVGDLVQSRPYRLTARIDADFDDVTAALVRDDVAGAVAAYAGPLLPNSEARAVVELRHRLDTRLRNAVLVSDDWDALDGWVAGSGIDDLDVWERLVSLLPAGSARQGHAVTQLNRLRAEYGLPALSATLMQRRPG